MAAIETRESCSNCSLYKCGLLDVSYGIDGSFATLSHYSRLSVMAGLRECFKILDRAPLKALDHFSILWFEEPHPIDPIIDGPCGNTKRRYNHLVSRAVGILHSQKTLS